MCRKRRTRRPKEKKGEVRDMGQREHEVIPKGSFQKVSAKNIWNCRGEGGLAGSGIFLKNQYSRGKLHLKNDQKNEKL